MRNEFITLLIHTLQMLPTEWLGILMYGAAIGIFFSLHRYFGKEGIFLFIIVAVIIANLQSLKAIELTFFDYPIAMGSILFTLCLFAVDVISEYYGKESAIKAIWLGFAGMLMLSLIMLLTLGTQVINAAPDSSYYHYVQVHDAMALLFTPTPALFSASLISYLVSQYIDMGFFLWLKKRWGERLLAFRTLLSTVLSTGVDNCLFSFLAWRVLYPLPIDFKSFLMTYIFGAFGLRVILSVVNSPLIYLARRQWEPAR